MRGAGAKEHGQRYAFLFCASQNRDPEPQKGQQSIRRCALQTARRANPEDPADQQPEIEATGMNQQPLQDVVVPAQISAAHRARVVEVRERALDRRPTSKHQTQSAGAAQPTAIAIAKRWSASQPTVEVKSTRNS